MKGIRQPENVVSIKKANAYSGYNLLRAQEMTREETLAVRKCRLYSLCRINLWARGAAAPGPAPRGGPRTWKMLLNKRKKEEAEREKKGEKWEREKKGRKEGEEKKGKKRKREGEINCF